MRCNIVPFGALVAAFCCLLPSAAAEPPRPLTIGALVSLTGDAARNGKNWLEGAEVAADDLRSAGRQVKLVVEDDASAPSKAATGFVKLVTVDKVDGVIGGTWDFLAETVFPLAQQYRVPFITPTNPVEVLSASARKNPWVFTNGLSLAAERRALRGFFRTRPVRRAALAYINVPYGTIHADLIRELALEFRFAISAADQISYDGFVDSLRLAAVHAARDRPDIIFAVSNYEGIDVLARELERLKLEIPMLMTHTLLEAYEFADSPNRYARAIGIFPRFTGEAFARAFRTKHGRQPYGYAPAGYDAVMFLAKLAETSGDIAGRALVYHGLTGTHSLPARDRAVVENEAVIMRVQDGRLVEVVR